MPLPVVCDRHDRLMLYLPLPNIHRCTVDGCTVQLSDEDRERLSNPIPEGVTEIRVT